MKVLLTGASGFVGSHLLDLLRRKNIPTVALVRNTSNHRLFDHHTNWLELRYASLQDPQGLKRAMEDATHVIHCAGCTKALNVSEFYTINQTGTRNLIQALPKGVKRFVHISSLAAVGPAKPGQKLTETAVPSPVSAYGKSKLAAEAEVRNHCSSEYVILRPPAVYGPRDSEFLKMFRSVKNHILPRPPAQELSLVFVEDLAEAVFGAMEHPAAAGKTYFVSHPETVTATQMAAEMARQMNVWTMAIRIPAPVLWGICCGADFGARVTRQANVVSLQKYPELVAAGWTCDASRLREEIGYECRTGMTEGITKALTWYQAHHWL